MAINIEDLDDDEDTTPMYDSSKYIVPDKGFIDTPSKSQSEIEEVEDWIYKDIFAGTNKTKFIDKEEPKQNIKWDKYRL